MSRVRTDLRAFPQRKSSISRTKFPPVQQDHVSRSSSSSPHHWATDMIVGLQLKTSSPTKEVKVKNNHGTPPKEKTRNHNALSSVGTPRKSNLQTAKSEVSHAEIDRLNQEISNLKIKLQELLDKIAKLEKENEKLKSKNSSQHKSIEQLKEENKSKTIKLSDLEELLRKQELIRKNEVDGLISQIDSKDIRIKELENVLTKRDKQLEQMKDEFQQTMEMKIKEHADKLEEAKANYNKELKIKDDKLRVLKSHMAEALKDNSRERQHQLEELTRELKKVSEEADILKTRMNTTKPTQTPCKNCHFLERELQNKILILRNKDVGLIELQQLCEKMEKQLMEQDELLRLWAKSKGKVIK